MSYTKIIINLFIGSYRDILNYTFEKENIDVIINVAKECKNFENSKIIHHHYFYEDSPSDLISNSFDEICDQIHMYRTSGKNVFIHCFAGKSRSASFVVIYLVKYLNYSLQEAYEYVNNLRNIYPNLGFVNQMIEYELKTTNKSTLDYDKIVIDNIFETIGFASKENIKKTYELTNKNIKTTIDILFANQTN